MAPVDPRLLRRSRLVRRMLVVSIVLATVTTALLLAQARLVAAAVADAFTGTPVMALAAAVAACLAVRAVIEWAHASVSARAAATVKAELRRDVVTATLDQHRVGALPSTSRLATLVDGGLDPLDGYIGRFLPQLVLSVIAPVAVIAVLLVIDPLSALIVILTLPLVVLFLVLVGLATRGRTDRRWQELARLGQHFSEVLRGLTLFSVHGRDQEEGLRRVGEQHRRQTMSALRMAFTSALVLELFSTLSVALVAVAIGLRVVHGDLSLETGLFALLIAPEAYLPLRRLGTQYHDATAGVDAASEALDLVAAAQASGSLLPSSRPTIEFTDVVIRYEGRDTPALTLAHDVIRPGETVAVTGRSGSGKSTLLSALLGFVPLTEGEIRLDGIPLSHVDIEAWRRQVAWVPQMPALLSGSVAENVCLGAPEASETEVQWALAAAGAGDLATDREVGEAGRELSSGERRRVGMARALLRVRCTAASVLLVDEPTAGLDAVREHRVLESLAALDVTVILVAHRPDAIRAADRELELVAESVMAS